MQECEFEILKSSHNIHWWYKGRQKLIEKVLKKYLLKRKLKICDAGSGYGSNINFLKNYGVVTALENNKGAINHLKKNFCDIDVIKWKSPQKLEVKFDLIVFADVLEHIKDDDKALEWSFNHLKKGGLILITVPSHNYLWTTMDDNLFHFRRYKKEELEKKLKKYFSIKFISYYNFFLFPLKIIIKIYDQILKKCSLQTKVKSYNITPNKYFNNILYKIMLFEGYCVINNLIPYGVSSICIAEIKD